MNKSASVPMQKLHMEMDDRGRPKIKVDNKYTPKPMRMTDMTPAMPYNNPKPQEVLSELNAVMPAQDSTRSDNDHQKERINLLKPMEIRQVEILEQILEELKKINGHV